MTVVPPPASPCVRAQLVYHHVEGTEAGSRFFLSYSGAAPSPANCVTLANDIVTAWGADIASLVAPDWTLQSVDVLDIATSGGASGISTSTADGSRSGDALPFQVATNVQYEIARRYRGGKPKMYLPPGVWTDTLTGATWQNAYVAAVQSGVPAFFAAIEADTVGSMGTLAHVNLSYYSGFKNIINSSGRERAVPTYRTAALLDTVTGYLVHAELASQRRRRLATTP